MTVRLARSDHAYNAALSETISKQHKSRMYWFDKWGRELVDLHLKEKDLRLPKLFLDTTPAVLNLEKFHKRKKDYIMTPEQLEEIAEKVYQQKPHITPPMLPVDPEVTKLIYEGRSFTGHNKYFAIRKKMLPIHRYPYIIQSSMEHNWYMDQDPPPPVFSDVPRPSRLWQEFTRRHGAFVQSEGVKFKVHPYAPK